VKNRTSILRDRVWPRRRIINNARLWRPSKNTKTRTRRWAHVNRFRAYGRLQESEREWDGGGGGRSHRAAGRAPPEHSRGRPIGRPHVVRERATLARPRSRRSCRIHTARHGRIQGPGDEPVERLRSADGRQDNTGHQRPEARTAVHETFESGEYRVSVRVASVSRWTPRSRLTSPQRNELPSSEFQLLTVVLVRRHALISIRSNRWRSHRSRVVYVATSIYETQSAVDTSTCRNQVFTRFNVWKTSNISPVRFPKHILYAYIHLYGRRHTQLLLRATDDHFASSPLDPLHVRQVYSGVYSTSQKTFSPSWLYGGRGRA